MAPAILRLLHAPDWAATPTATLADRAFQIDTRLIARQRDQALAGSGKFFENRKRFAVKAALIFSRTAIVEGSSALTTEVQSAKQFADAALGVANIEALLNQLNNGANGPATAHLRARHSFFIEQRTELGQLLLSEPPLAMLPAPQWVVLQAVEAVALVQAHPTRNRFWVNKEDGSRLLKRVAVTDEPQGGVAQALMGFSLLVLEAAHGFKASLFREPRISLRNRYFRCPVIVSFADGSPRYLGVPSI